VSDCDCPKSSVTSVVRTSSMVFKYLMLDVALELMVVSESTVVVDKTKCMSSHSILENVHMDSSYTTRGRFTKYLMMMSKLR